jgi:hypothetical protein
MDEQEIFIAKDAARDIVKFKYAGPQKGQVQSFSLGSIITMGYYLKEIDTIVGYDELDNIFLYQLGT